MTSSSLHRGGGCWMLSAVMVIICLTLTSHTANGDSSCGQCVRSRCQRVYDCPVGVVRDSCGCCDVCALGLLEPCEHRQVAANRGMGFCGTGLRCKLRDLPGVVEALCQCEIEEDVCGTDGLTYPSECHMQQSMHRSGTTIRVVTRTPCESPPVIVTSPSNAVNETGDYAAFGCEVKGQPIPHISWSWKRVDGTKFDLPNDDLSISVNVRGGPEKYTKTGWLQITNVQKHHEGDYFCKVENRRGQVVAEARLKVTKKRSKKNKSWK